MRMQIRPSKLMVAKVKQARTMEVYKKDSRKNWVGWIEKPTKRKMTMVFYQTLKR